MIARHQLRMIMMWKILLIIMIMMFPLFLVLAIYKAGVEPVQAAYPGENGMLAFSEAIDNYCSDSNQTYLINPDGSGKITAPVVGFKLTWSPDGSKIAYLLDNYIHVANADGSNDIVLTQANEYSLAWSPDSKKLAFDRNISGSTKAKEIYIIDIETKQESRLTYDAQDSGGTTIWNRNPSWNPDAGKDIIAYEHYEWRSGSGVNPKQGIWTMKSDSSAKNPFIYSEATSPDWTFPHQYQQPDWEPNGTSLAIQVMTPNEGSYDYQIGVATWPDGDITLISPSYSTALSPTWAPNGTKIAYISTPGNPYHISIINPDGSAEQQVGGDNACNWVSWQYVPGEIIVNSKENNSDGNPGDGICDTGNDLPEGDPECTFQAAIQETNASPGKDRITFDIPDGYAIMSGDILSYTITDPVIIDGTTQPGSSMVEIETPLWITAGDSEVRGLSTTDRIILTENGGNILEGNYLGIKVDGSWDASDSGIEIWQSSNNRIGGSDHDPGVCNRQCNLITVGEDNPESIPPPIGIVISGTNSTGNVIQGNFIGTDISGKKIPLGDQQYAQLAGIKLEGALSNQIGGSSTGEGNLISGNEEAGVLIEGGGFNFVQGNLIGVDISGSKNITATQSTGVSIVNSTANWVVENVISGLDFEGVNIQGVDSINNVVIKNKIGTTADGTYALGNRRGITIQDTSLSINQIKNNIIAFNDIGIFLIFGNTHSAINGNSIHDNQVGVHVLDSGDAEITENTIFNNELGVWVEMESLGAKPTGIRISKNSIYGNRNWTRSGLGIDLSPEGLTPNDVGDSDDGPNTLLNFPNLGFAALQTGGNLRIGGSYDGAVFSHPYRLEFFANPTCDPSGYGEGEHFLGFTDLTTDIAGRAVIDVVYTQTVARAGQFLTATAIDGNGNTSEFSRCVEILFGTDLSASASAGSTTLQVTSNQGFYPGDAIRINPGGANQEDNTVTGFGSLLLASPLQYDHQAGEPVVNLYSHVFLPTLLR